MKEYTFVDGEFCSEFEIKKSRFIANIIGEVDSEKAQEFVNKIKKQFPDARHNCYAFIGDEFSRQAKFSDDGEPSGTAGQPILEVLKKNSLVKTAVVVTRYFGGIKLGASGLLSAYTKSVADVIAVSKLATKKLATKMCVEADYSSFSALDGFIRSDEFVLDSINYGDKVNATLFVLPEEANVFKSKVAEMTSGKCLVTEKENNFVKFKK